MAKLSDAEILERARSSSPFNVVFAEARVNRCMTRGQLAAKTGFTTGFISSYEEVAANPTAATMLRYAMALGLRFTIDRSGITIHDEALQIDVLEKWFPENCL